MANLNINLNFDIKDQQNAKVLSKMAEAIRREWGRAIIVAAPRITRRISEGIVNGSDGLTSFFASPVGQWIRSEEGVGQLGFPDAKPFSDLVTGLLQSVEVKKTSSIGKGKGFSLGLNLLNLKVIARHTPHPAQSSSAKLNIDSWFVDWIMLGVPVTDAGFVPFTDFFQLVQGGRGKKEQREIKSISLPRSFPAVGIKSGFMFPKGFLGSTGSWSPPDFINAQAVENWLSNNIPAITRIMKEEMVKALRR